MKELAGQTGLFPPEPAPDPLLCWLWLAHVLGPASIHAGRVLDTPGTKVLMKTGRQLPALLAALEQAGRLENSALVCNCGLPDEQVCPDLSCGQPQVQPGYFTTGLVKE